MCILLHFAQGARPFLLVAASSPPVDEVVGGEEEEEKDDDAEVSVAAIDAFSVFILGFCSGFFAAASLLLLLLLTPLFS